MSIKNIMICRPARYILSLGRLSIWLFIAAKQTSPKPASKNNLCISFMLLWIRYSGRFQLGNVFDLCGFS